MPDQSSQKTFALSVVTRLREAGFIAYWAGGCVRDELLGKMPKDYDVATNAVPEAVRKLFGKRRTIAIGEAFGVITVLGKRPSDNVEVATFRHDVSYSDGRRPDAVTFSNPEEDAQRRDFTINGLFYDPIEEKVLDYVGGREDLTRKTIRAIGSPTKRFEEDKLRMLRAVRFATTLGFSIEPETLAAIQTHADDLHAVSAERIGAECQRMLSHPNRAIALQLLAESRLLIHTFPELVPFDKQSRGHDNSLWKEILRIARNLESDSFAAALASLLYIPLGPSIRKHVETGAFTPKDDSHENAPRTQQASLNAKPALQSIGKRLKLANKDWQRAAWLLNNIQVSSSAIEQPWSRLQPVLNHPGAKELLALQAAIFGKNNASLAHCKEQLALPKEKLAPPYLLRGDDLVALGYRPSKIFARVLQQVRDDQLDGRIRTEQEATDLAKQLFAENHSAK